MHFNWDERFSPVRGLAGLLVIASLAIGASTICVWAFRAISWAFNHIRVVS